MTAELLSAIRSIVQYNWDAEEQDFESFEGDPEHHIFTSLRLVDTWLDEQEALALQGKKGE